MIRWFLTGGAIAPFLLTCGLFFIIYLKGQPFLSPCRMLRSMRAGGEGDGVSSFRALTQALAGTLGVGNIVGVANALAVGGAGAVFWMWISALAAMILKYAETVLAVAHRREAADGSFYGGAYYYIKDCFLGRRAVHLARGVSALFAVLMIFNALCMGCVIQAEAVSSAVENVTGMPTVCIGFLLVFLTLPFLLRGSRGISALTEYLVPVMTLGFIVLSAAVLILRREYLGTAFSSVFAGALKAESIGGGILGFLTSRALRVGTMRGLLSNEAGCGTSPTAHASANAHDPASQGVWGIFEVFVDTVLLCTVTALVILVSPCDPSLFAADVVSLAIRSYSSVLGGFADLFFALAIFCFGYATLICWGGYSLEALRFLSARKRFRVFYVTVFAVCIFLGAVGAPRFVWDLSDFVIAAMTALNLSLLLLMRREIRMHTERWHAAELDFFK